MKKKSETLNIKTAKSETSQSGKQIKALWLKPECNNGLTQGLSLGLIKTL